jgi:hypothetical protein
VRHTAETVVVLMSVKRHSLRARVLSVGQVRSESARARRHHSDEQQREIARVGLVATRSRNQTSVAERHAQREMCGRGGSVGPGWETSARTTSLVARRKMIVERI